MGNEFFGLKVFELEAWNRHNILFFLHCVVVDAAVFDVAPGLAAPGLAAPGLADVVEVAALEEAVVLEEPAALLEESGTRGLAAAVEPAAVETSG